MNDPQTSPRESSSYELPPRRAPGPRELIGLGAVLAFRRDPLRYFLELQAEWGGIVRRRFGPFIFHTFFDPKLVREALVDHHELYTKRGVIDELLPLLGNGLLASEGERWKGRREGIAPLLGRRSLGSLLPAMELEANALVARWESAAREPQVVDASVGAMHFAITVIGRVLFGLDLGDRADSISCAVETVARLALRRSNAMVKLPLRFPTPVNRAYRRALAQLDAVVIAGIREPGGTEDRLLPHLREVIDRPTGKPLTERDLRDESMSLLLAGHETTANTLAWTLDHLARETELQQRVCAEAREHIDALAQGGSLGLTPMPLLDAVVSESLRLAPPAWLVMRRVLDTHEVGGYVIPRRSFVGIPVHAIHRNPVYWPEPDRFRPERFLETHEGNQPAFLPFSIGPRRCPGESFARAETRILLSKLLVRFQFESISSAPDADPLATLRPAQRVRVRLRMR